jgi:hypothetical protein
MRPAFPGRTLALGLALLSAAAVHAADSPPDPLRLVPDQADVLIQVHQPRALVESLNSLDLYKQLESLEQVKELLDSTSYRRFFQLVAYYEKELGAPYPELIDKLAGGGIVVASKFGANPAPAVMVVQGRDAALTRKFVDLAVKVVDEELARQEAKAKLQKDTYRQVEVIHAGKEFYAAVLDAALLISNNDKAMQAALDLHLDNSGKHMGHVANVAAARKLLPPDPLATLWVNLDAAHKAPNANDVFKLPRKEFGILLTIFFGGNLDVAGRAPYACAGLYGQKDGFLLTTRLPAGRDGMDPGAALHIPPEGAVGSRPLLEPKNVLVSSSFYLDVGKFWEDRARLYPPDQVKALEEFDKNSAAALTGTRFSKLITSAGPYHRFVAVQPEKPGYGITPKTAIPAFAFVVEQRDPDVFAKTLETLIRAGALAGSAQAGLKLKEETHGDIKITAYRFDEKFPLKADVQDIRFNFSPCFFTVGKQWVIASTLELGHELCDLLLKEDGGATTKGSPASVRTAFYSQGGVELLKSLEDVLVTQAILDQAVPVEKAREQVKKFIAGVGQLGTLHLESGYDATTFHYDVRLKLSK